MKRESAVSTGQIRPLYIPRKAEILSVTELTPTEKLFRLRQQDGEELNHQPGQFIQLSILGFGEAPISVASSPTRHGFIELGIRRAGSLTAAMHQLQPGDVVGIRGPYGKPFDITSMERRDLLLISGGCGLAPLRSLIQYVADRRDNFGRVIILHGAKNPQQIMFREELDSWDSVPGFSCDYTVDSYGGADCYNGISGRITELIPPLYINPGTTEAVLVGPAAMYPPVISRLREKGLTSGHIVVSLERQMRCGVGKCGHCSIEHLYCCQDGPVFRLSDIEHLHGIF